MRNLKKFLALVLAMMMVMSLMVTVNAASSDFSDADKIDSTYVEAIDVLSALGVLEGDSRGFRPGDPITRAEVAAVLYRIKSGDVVKNSKALDIYRSFCNFTDVAGTGSDWAAGAIGYASSFSLVVGDGNGKFRPADNVTGYEVLIMMLRALGYDQNDELKGTMYQFNAYTLAQGKGLIDNISNVDWSKPATREVVAEVAFQALANVETVEYDPSIFQTGYSSTGTTLGEANFGLKLVAGEIIEVNREKGTMTLADYSDDTGEQLAARHRELYTVTNIDTTEITWEDIGYYVAVWGTPVNNRTDNNTYEAITDVEWIGVSLYDNEGKASYDKNDNREGIMDIAKTNKVVVSNIYTDEMVADTTGTNKNIETTARVYFNGERLPVYADLADVKTKLGGTAADASKYPLYYYDLKDHAVKYVPTYNSSNNGLNRPLDIVNGVFVDFVDNDLGGEAEVIIIKEYTVATVAGDTRNGINTGHNAIIKDHYYFDAHNIDNLERHIAVDVNETKYHVDDVVVDGTLTVGQLITYVEYRDEAYVTVPEPVRATLNRVDISRTNQEDTIRLDIGKLEKAGWTRTTPPASGYYAQAYYVANLKTGTARVDYLANNQYVGKDYDVYCDVYGNILAVTEPVAYSDYLYIAKIDHSSEVHNTTEALVVYTDGTVDTIIIDLGTNELLGSNEENLVKHIWRYDVDPETGYAILLDSIDEGRFDDTLNSVCGPFGEDEEDNGSFNYGDKTKVVGYRGLDFTKISLSKNSVGLPTNANPVVKMDNNTVIYDVRGITDRTTAIADANTYKGRSSLPSTAMTGVTLHVVVDEDDYVVYGFLTDANTSAATTTPAQDIVVYQTDEWHYIGNGLYTMPVIDLATGKAVDAELDANQLACIIGQNTINRAVADSGHGVGIYYFKTNKSTPAAWYESFAEKWVPVKWSSGTLEQLKEEDGKLVFDKVLPYGTVDFWTFDIKNGDAYDYEPNRGTDTKKAWLNKNASGEVVGIYVVDGTEAESTTRNVSTVTEKYGKYYVAEGYVTGWDPFPVYKAWVLNKNGSVLGSAEVIVSDNGAANKVLEITLPGMLTGETFDVTALKAYYYEGAEELERDEITWSGDLGWTFSTTAGANNVTAKYTLATKTLTLTRNDNADGWNCYMLFQLDEDPTVAQPENPTPGSGGTVGSGGQGIDDIKPEETTDADDIDGVLKQLKTESGDDLYEAHGISTKTKGSVMTITIDSTQFATATKNANKVTGNTGEDYSTVRMAPNMLHESGENLDITKAGAPVLVVGVGYDTGRENTTHNSTEVTFTEYTKKDNKSGQTWGPLTLATEKVNEDSSNYETYIYDWFTIADWTDGAWVLREERTWTVKYMFEGSEITWTVVLEIK